MTAAGADSATSEAIIATVLDYAEGWFDGDAERMGRALHPELVKRCIGIEGDDPKALETLTWDDMVTATREGVGRGEDAPDRQMVITVDAIHGNIAAATCTNHRYIDLLQLVETPEGWRIVAAAWCLR